MNPLLLVIEDKLDILANIKLSLEFNNFRVLTAPNGQAALRLLSTAEELPDLIISDIMMPEMDGYELFKTLAAHPHWARIPFIFLSARATPEDIRFGKMLGVDDYLTKPFDEEDLLAIVTGKLTRIKQWGSLQKVIEDQVRSLSQDLTPSISEDETENVWLFVVVWDEEIGPRIKVSFPQQTTFPQASYPTIPPVSMDSLGLQLYQAAISIYGWEGLYSAQGLLLNVENIKKSGYIFFDSYPDRNVRGGRRQFMLAVIAPKISYFNSLKIKEILQGLSTQIKVDNNWDLQKYWDPILKILKSPAI